MPGQAHEAAPPDLFTDMTEKSPGLLKTMYRNGEDKDHYAILESLGGGLGVIDFDGDGLLDLVVPGGGDYASPDKKTIIGYPTRVFKNVGEWRFQEVTDEVLPTQALFYSHGVAVADYDRDGWTDLLVTGYGRVALYRNADDKGKRKLVEVTEAAGLLRSGHFWATSAAFADLDGDGYPDLYVCQYADWSWQNNPTCPGYRVDIKRDVCAPRLFNAKQHALFRNTGKGGFVEVTKEAGVRVESDSANVPKAGEKTLSYCGKGLAVVAADLNADGKPDLYVGNDTTENLLYLNRSTPGQIKLEEVGEKLGVATDWNRTANGSMGVDAADIDGTGKPALWVTNYEGEQFAMYRMAGEKDETFYHGTSQAGLAAVGQTYVGWGTGFLDVDNDGWMDIAVANGHVIRHPTKTTVAQKPILFLNRGGGQGKFKVATDQGGPYFRTPHKGRGLAVADLDNDGRPDLAFNHVNEPPAVLRNVCGGKHSWLGVHLTAPEHGDVVGARAMLDLGGRKLTLFQKGGGSYASASDPRLLFGLGTDGKVGRLTVYWPSGGPRVEHWDGLEINRYHTLVQGKGSAK